MIDYRDIGRSPLGIDKLRAHQTVTGEWELYVYRIGRWKEINRSRFVILLCSDGAPERYYEFNSYECMAEAFDAAVQDKPSRWSLALERAAGCVEQGTALSTPWFLADRGDLSFPSAVN